MPLLAVVAVGQDQTVGRGQAPRLDGERVLTGGESGRFVAAFRIFWGEKSEKKGNDKLCCDIE